MTNANAADIQLLVTHYVTNIRDTFAALDEDFRPRGHRRTVYGELTERVYEVRQAFGVHGRLSIDVRLDYETKQFVVDVSLSAGSMVRDIETQTAFLAVQQELLTLAARAKVELLDQLPSPKTPLSVKKAVFRVLKGSASIEEVVASASASV